LNDTVKSLSFTRKLALPVLGLVENMSGYVCPCCGEISDAFGRGGGENMANQNGIHFLGRVPIDTVLVGLLDAVSKGEVPGAAVTDEDDEEIGEAGSIGEFPLLDKYLQTTSSQVWAQITKGVVEGIKKRREGIMARFEGTQRS
jgi:hypothetical protein